MREYVDQVCSKWRLLLPNPSSTHNGNACSYQASVLLGQAKIILTFLIWEFSKIEQ